MKLTNEEKQLKAAIKQIVRESLENYGAFNTYEEDNKEDDGKDGRKADMNSKNEKEEKLRSEVESYFKQPVVDCAYFAYRLANVDPKEGSDTNEMKNARSLFMKKLNHEDNESGYPYSFDSSEVNRLHSLISSDQISEAVNKAMKKILG